MIFIKGEVHLINMFKKATGIEEICDYILYSKRHKILQSWEDIYGEALTMSHLNLACIPEQDQVALIMDKDTQVVDVTLTLLQMLRSYRMVNCLTFQDNISFLNSTFPMFYEQLFEHMYRKCLKNKDLEFIDYNNIAEFILELSKTQPLYTISAVIHFNFLSHLISKLSYSRVMDVMLILILPVNPEKNITPELSEMLWKSLKNNDFFDILGVKLLHCYQSTEHFTKLQHRSLDKSILKFTAEPKSHGHEAIPVLTAEDMQKFLILEEKVSLKFDIDGILGVLDHHTTNNMNTITESQMEQSSKSSIEEESFGERMAGAEDKNKNGLVLNYNLHPMKRIESKDEPKPLPPKLVLSSVKKRLTQKIESPEGNSATKKRRRGEGESPENTTQL